MEELTKLKNVEVVKYSLSTAEDRLRRFKTIAAEIGFPYRKIGNYSVYVMEYVLDFELETKAFADLVRGTDNRIYLRRKGSPNDLHLLYGRYKGDDFLSIEYRCYGRDWHGIPNTSDMIYY